jgi:hypothetical protein
MPSIGYETIGLKPTILQRLQSATDELYPSMFLPSALIMMMNEIKRGQYTVEIHDLEVDFSGRYTSVTPRSDVKEWLVQNYKNLQEVYNQRYRADSFTKFASIFMINVFESKSSTKDYIIRLKESDFQWLQEEFQKRKQDYKIQFGIYNFERFADIFLKDLLNRFNEARKY